MSQLAIVEAFADLPDTRRSAGQRHTQEGILRGNNSSAKMPPCVWHYSPWRWRLAIVGFSRLGIG
jgi:hypothetical protein